MDTIIGRKDIWLSKKAKESYMKKRKKRIYNRTHKSLGVSVRDLLRGSFKDL